VLFNVEIRILGYKKFPNVAKTKVVIAVNTQKFSKKYLAAMKVMKGLLSTATLYPFDGELKFTSHYTHGFVGFCARFQLGFKGFAVGAEQINEQFPSQ
jgi:2'-5' RNA ligase